MEARLLLRTHYQADEPALLAILVRDVASASHSTFRETAADRLSKEARSRGLRLNPAAAGYVVDLARTVGLITDRLSLTGRGRVLAMLAGDHNGATFDPQLNEAEQLFILAVFLAADGLALSLLARHLLVGPATKSELIANHVIEEIFREVINFYLAHSTDIRVRTELRGELSRLASDYRGRTSQHKLDVRLTVLERVGIVWESAGRKVTSHGEPARRLAALSDDPAELEDLLRKDGELAIAIRVKYGESLGNTPDLPSVAELTKVYKAMVGSSAEFVEVAALADYLTIQHVVTRRTYVTRSQLDEELLSLSRTDPRRFRFHVDRLGRPAFLAISGAG